MDATMSSDRGKKLRAIRKAEKLTQQQFSDLTGISLATIKNYERGRFEVGLKVIDAVLELERFEGYMMWLMKGKTAPELGQIAPPLSPDGYESSEESQVTTAPEAKSHR